ncbi:hypothetical protein P3S68_031834 [Capsicum galapagoense]
MYPRRISPWPVGLGYLGNQKKFVEYKIETHFFNSIPQITNMSCSAVNAAIPPSIIGRVFNPKYEENSIGSAVTLVDLQRATQIR